MTFPIDLSEFAAMVPPPDDDDLEDGAPGRFGVEVLISGKHVDVAGEPPACEHRAVNAEVVVAFLVDDDEPTVIVRRELMVKARCGECSCSFRFVAGSAHPSRALGELGLVAEIEPTE